VPNPARVYDYLLGGKDNFEVDRITAQAGIGAFPDIARSARASRAFLARVVRYLAESGIRQFLDIGTGLPSANNVHEVAQAVAPESRIVYVDNDPVVMLHARALLTSTPQGIAARKPRVGREGQVLAPLSGFRRGRFRSPGGRARRRGRTGRTERCGR
jgi:hypothetical protein